MSPGDVHTWLAIAALAISIGGSLYIWLTSGSRANAEQIGDTVKRVEECERRCDRLEVDLRHLPDRDQVQRMEITLTQMKGEIAVLNERLMPVAAIADRLQEFLLEQHARGAR